MQTKGEGMWDVGNHPSFTQKKEKNMKTGYFHLPGLFEFFDFYTYYIELFNNEREKFNSWCEIGSIYGAPLGAIWNGGRIAAINTMYTKDVVNFMKINDLPCRLTFSNCFLNKNHLNDNQCNALLEEFYWGNKNSIIVNSLVLEQYIRDNYPNYKLVSSTTKCLQNPVAAKDEIDKNYDIVVLDYNFNNNIEFLHSIEHKEKCELLINPVCYPNCSRRREHYEHISKVILRKPVDTNNFECNCETKMFWEAMQSPLFISIEAIEQVYLPMGFQHFKIEGRTTTIYDLVEILVYYMVKPIHQVEIRQKLMAYCW